MPYFRLLAALFVSAVLFIPPCSAKDDAPIPGRQVIRFGTLPVVQALPLFVAAEKGFFKEEGLDVELVRFNSALEKDVAFTSGQIAGYFGDLQTCIVLNGNGAPIRIVAEVYNATGKQRTFALLASPKTESRSLAEIVKTGLAVSSNTILDYLTTKFVTSKGISLADANLVEIKNIPIRMQMLLGGQVSAAVLPEPLATLAEAKGARVVMDDAGTGLSSTVLAFNDKFLGQSPEKAKNFLRAVSRASAYIDGKTDDIRVIMNRECRVPDQLQKTYPIPVFPKLSLPTEPRVTDVYRWLRDKGSLKRELTYRQMVANGYLP